MNPIVNLVVTELNANKAIDVVSYDVRKRISYTNDIVICSGNSLTHSRALARIITLFLKKNHHLTPINRTKSPEDSSWILIDYADFIIHIFYGETRGKYRLEEIFSSKNS